MSRPPKTEGALRAQIKAWLGPEVPVDALIGVPEVDWPANHRNTCWVPILTPPKGLAYPGLHKTVTPRKAVFLAFGGVIPDEADLYWNPVCKPGCLNPAHGGVVSRKRPRHYAPRKHKPPVKAKDLTMTWRRSGEAVDPTLALLMAKPVDHWSDDCLLLNGSPSGARSSAIRRIIWQTCHGRLLHKSERLYAKVCGDPLCMNPKHSVVSTGAPQARARIVPPELEGIPLEALEGFDDAGPAPKTRRQWQDRIAICQSPDPVETLLKLINAELPALREVLRDYEPFR